MLIHNIFDLAFYIGIVDDDYSELDYAKAVAKTLFKYTACGVTFGWDKTGVTVTGFVEGVDAQLPEHRLEYPFDSGDWDKVVEQSDNEGCAAWDSTHGCERCATSYSEETGHKSIDPNCQHCKGQGVIR